jgi:hypothetical protein
MDPAAPAFSRIFGNVFAFTAFKSTEPWLIDYVTLDLHAAMRQVCVPVEQLPRLGLNREPCVNPKLGCADGWCAAPVPLNCRLALRRPGSCPTRRATGWSWRRSPSPPDASGEWERCNALSAMLHESMGCAPWRVKPRRGHGGEL